MIKIAKIKTRQWTKTTLTRKSSVRGTAREPAPVTVYTTEIK